VARVHYVILSGPPWQDVSASACMHLSVCRAVTSTAVTSLACCLQFYGACLRDPQSAMLIMELCEVRSGSTGSSNALATPRTCCMAARVHSMKQGCHILCWRLVTEVVWAFHPCGELMSRRSGVLFHLRGATCDMRCRRTRALPGTAPGSTSRWTWRGASTSCTPAASSTGDALCCSAYEAAHLGITCTQGRVCHAA
jgi:hypothetical protein